MIIKNKKTSSHSLQLRGLEKQKKVKLKMIGSVAYVKCCTQEMLKKGMELNGSSVHIVWRHITRFAFLSMILTLRNNYITGVIVVWINIFIYLIILAISIISPNFLTTITKIPDCVANLPLITLFINLTLIGIYVSFLSIYLFYIFTSINK